MTTPNRDLDIVLYGATGFVGQQTVQYLAEHGEGIRFALAGRNAAKLERVREQCGARNAEIIVADGDDRAALDALAARTRVALSTAGPFCRHSDKLVDACVANKTHYVDITGETPWVNDLIARHHAQAQKDGTRIVPFCGMDSVPSDLGAWWIAREAQARFGKPCVQVKTGYKMRGGLNGGTLASTLDLVATDRNGVFTDPFLMTPADRVPANKKAHRDPRDVEYSADMGSWLAPFAMAPVNTRVVRRTAALLPTDKSPYAPDFVYQEYLRTGEGLGGQVTARAIQLVTGALMSALQHKATQRLLRKFGPSPGEGPSQDTMNNGYVRGRLVAQTVDGSQLKGTWSDRGDPGNRVTTRLVCEAALTLVKATDSLPGGPTFGGVLTPAVALGEPYLARLRGAGVQLKLD